MRVLYITDPGSVGGAARALVEVTRTLKEMGVEPIVCTGVYDKLNEEFDDLGIKNFACGHQSAMNTKSPYRWKRPLKYPYESLRYYLSLPKAIKKIEEEVDITSIDLIHTNSARNDIGCLLNKKHGILHIMHIREFGQEDFNCCIYRPDYYEFINTYTTKFLAISNAVGASWIKKGVSKDKLQILYDGVDIDAIEYTDHEFTGIDLKMIIAGGVCEPKGQHIAIEAIGVLPDEIRDHVTLDVAGWSDLRYMNCLKRRIHELGLTPQIRFLGARDDLYNILKNYDIGLTCSKSEGFGRVTAEYLYAGLGAIGTDTGATPELINDGVTGLLFHYPDHQSLALCIERLFRNREFLNVLSRNAHNDAQKFSARRNAKEIMDVYHELLKE